jgi:peptide/nickel transport system substrate-binding protein
MSRKAWRDRLRASLLATTVALAAGGTALQAQAEESVVRATLHADLRIIDPFWTTQTIAGIHAMAIYDTLFGSDENLVPHPQMVGDYEVSDDGKIYTFTLRDGLKFHDGQPVTTKDVIASLKRWGAKDQAGKTLFSYVTGLDVVDDKTFKMTLSEPYGMVLDTLGKTGTMVPVIMREKEALTPPDEQITEAIGSGPYKMLRDEWVPGSKTVYVKNPDYIPRDEPPSGFSGHKEAKVDRLELVWIPDSQTAIQALIAGEIDILEQPPIDFLPILESAEGVKIETTGAIDSHWGTLRLNHLHPPFDNPAIRRAMFKVVNQEDFMATVVGNPEYYRECHGYITCGTPLANDAGSEAYQYDPKAAYEEMKAAGYNDEPITILAATDHPTITPGTQVLINAMREAGINLDVQSIDWGSVVARRAKREPPSEGGWNIFMTTSSGTSATNPVINTWLGAGCEKANVGWPCDSVLEDLRTKMAFARTIEERKELAKQIQARAFEVVPYINWGQWTQPFAYRADKVSGIVPNTGLFVLWNIEKKG